MMQKLKPPKSINIIEKTQEITNKKYIFPNTTIGIIIPAFNEEYTINNVLSKIPKNLSPLMKIIVINDGSTDNTIKSVKKNNRNDLILINHEINKGNGAAVRTGFNYCKNKFDVIITMDADGQHRPNDIKKLLFPIINENKNFVIGNRFGYYYDMPLIKKISSKLMSILYSFLFWKKISDPTNGFRAITTKLIKDVQFECDYSTIQEVLFKLMPKANFKEISIKIESRTHGNSFINLRKYLIITMHQIWDNYIKIFLFNPNLFINQFKKREKTM